MIEIPLSLDPLWIPLSHRLFDQSEFSEIPKEEREKVFFRICPFTTSLADRVNQRVAVSDILQACKDLADPEQDPIVTEQCWATLLEVVLDWRGIVDETEEQISYEEENLKRIALNYPRLADGWLAVSLDMVPNYKKYRKAHG